MANRDLKMCQSCRALIPAGATQCEMCGAEGHYAARQGVDGEAGALLGAWPVTMILMTANLAVYGLVLFYQSQFSEQGGFAFEPNNNGVLDAFGAVYPQVRRSHEWWRLIAYAFLHGGLLHIGMNMFGLWQAGRLAEEIWGRAQYILLYLFSGLGGGVLVVLMGKGITVGASGAIFGLIAALAAHGYRRRHLALQQFTLSWLLYGLAMSFSPRVSMAGHVGGAIIGALLGWFMPDEETLRQSIRRVRLMQMLAALCVIAMLATSAVVARNLKTVNAALAIQTVSEPILRTTRNLLRHQRAQALLAWKYFPQSLSADVQQYAPQAFENLFGKKAETISNEEINKKVLQIQQAFCSEVSTLEHLSEPDAEFAQIKPQLVQSARTICAQPVWRADTAKAQSLSDFEVRDEAFDQAVLAYWQWLEKRAAQMGMATRDLLPNESYEKFARDVVRDIQQTRQPSLEGNTAPQGKPSAVQK